MDAVDLYPEDLVFEDEATAATGVPGAVIRQWARRGKIRRFPGRRGACAGNGRQYTTMYALPEVRERARTYRPRTVRTQAA